MAKIFKTDEQEQALKDILENLKILEGLNEVIIYENLENFSIRTNGKRVEDGKNISKTIQIPFEIMVPVLKDYRKKLVADTEFKSKKYNIQLEDSEIAVLENKKKEFKTEETCQSEKLETENTEMTVEEDPYFQLI